MDIQQLVTYIVAMVIMLGLSAVFSMTETAFNAASKSRLKAMENPKADKVLELLDRYDDLLSTILVGNNVVNIALASVGTVFFVSLVSSGGATLSTVVITIAVLIFGELTPKSIAKDMPEKIAMAMAPIFSFLMTVLAPVNFLFRQWNKLMDRIIPGEEEIKTTSEELLVLVEEAEQEGSVDKEEGELLRSAIEFSDREVQDILTHRVDLEAVPATCTKEELSDRFIESRYSRILVYKDSIDDIIGVVHLKDFYGDYDKKNFNLKKMMTPPIFVPPTMKIDDCLRPLQQEQSSVAVVTDEFGGTQGIVTVEDVVEELVGEIWDEHDEVEEDYISLDDNTWLVSGKADLEKTFDMFDTPLEEELEDTQTVSGWVMEELGHIPEKGETFEYENLCVEVTDTDSRRVVEIKVVVTAPDSETENSSSQSTSAQPSDESNQDPSSPHQQERR